MNKALWLFLGLCFVTACSRQEEPVTREWTATSVPNIMSINKQYSQPVETAQSVTTQTDIEIDPHTYMQAQAQKLHDELLSTGIQLKQIENKIILIIPDAVLFGSNQNTIDAQIKPTLSAVSKIIKEYDRTRIEIVGHTDNTISVSVGKTSSLRHANALANFLRLNGVNINRITVDGVGSQSPLTTNETAAGRARNRRVEMTLANIQ